MTHVPRGWAAAPVLWIFPVLALCRKEVPGLKGRGEGDRAGLCVPGDLFWGNKAYGSGDSCAGGFKKLGISACACPYLPMLDCVFWCLSVPACAHANVGLCLLYHHSLLETTAGSNSYSRQSGGLWACSLQKYSGLGPPASLWPAWIRASS